jgi:hypothetical protein
MPTPRRFSSLARPIVLFLLLGAAVNVAVAWMAAIVMPWPEGRLRWSGEVSGAGVHAIRHESFALHWTITSVFSRSELEFGCGVVDPKERLAARLDEVVPLWLTQDGLPQHREMIAAGWPMKSAYCLGERGSLPVGPHVRQMAWRWFKMQMPASFVPARPLWAGFAMNTLFYAVILFALIRGPFMARRALRRRRGLCVDCGYDLRGRGPDHVACPECGAAC